ncbi:MAG TPA: hypothetical protein VH206_14330 [Xanthobacteraceae bacterium]|jgi:hypothetical protein|nr:hypothetical protein [Xanthobacteraceae bacterium]
MDRSLKSVLGDLADILNVSPDALYERQRALVRERLLKFTPGTRRKIGVSANLDTIATLVVGMLASSSLTDSGLRTRSMLKALPGPAGQVCKLTGAKNFQDAIEAILSSLQISSRVKRIRVSGPSGTAQIFFDKDDQTVFLANRHDESGLLVSVDIVHDTIHELTKRVLVLLAESEKAK